MNTPYLVVPPESAETRLFLWIAWHERECICRNPLLISKQHMSAFLKYGVEICAQLVAVHEAQLTFASPTKQFVAALLSWYPPALLHELHQARQELCVCFWDRLCTNGTTNSIIVRSSCVCLFGSCGCVCFGRACVCLIGSCVCVCVCVRV